MRMRGKMVREKQIFVREKSVKSQGISFQTRSGHPENECDHNYFSIHITY